MTYRLRLAAFLAGSLIASSICLADASEQPGAVPSPVEQTVGRDTTATLQPELSADANEIAMLTEIFPIYKQLQMEQQNARLKGFSGADSLRHNQRIIYLHGKINQYLHTATLEVNSLLGRLNSGLAQLADRKAVISDERARMLRRNTTINLVSGGLTKIGGYTSALSSAVTVPTNVLEVFDGAVQVGLSAVNMRQQQSEKELSKTKPAILTAFLSNKNDEPKYFPESVWRYLTVSPSGKTRRQTLIAQWTASGRLSNGPLGRRRATNGQGTTILRMDDLDDMTAMMSDIKSIVSGMESGLMQLSEVLKNSYNNDPEI